MATRCSSSSDHNEVVELFSEKSMEIIVSGTATPVCRPEHDKQHVSSAALAERQVDRRRTDLVAVRAIQARRRSQDHACSGGREQLAGGASGAGAAAFPPRGTAHNI